MTIYDNFREVSTIDEANKLDLEIWSFIRFSESRQKYIFKRKVRK